MRRDSQTLRYYRKIRAFFDSLVRVVLRYSCHFGHGGHALGYFLAPIDWPRHVLDTGAHRDLHVRRSGGTVVRVSDSFDHD